MTFESLLAYSEPHIGTVTPGRSTNGDPRIAITSDNDTRQITTIVTVRVPNGENDDLITNAEQRFSGADEVLAVTAAELRGLQPGLSATDVIVRVTVETDRAQSRRSVVLQALTWEFLISLTADNTNS